MARETEQTMGSPRTPYAELAELRAELERRDAQATELETELAGARERVTSLETELAEERECTENLSELANERREQLTKLEERLEEAEERYEEAKWRLGQARHFERLVRRRKTLIAALIKTLRAKNKANVALKAGLDGLRTHKAAAEINQQKLLARIDSLKTKLKQAEETLAVRKDARASDGQKTAAGQ